MCHREPATNRGNQRLGNQAKWLPKVVTSVVTQGRLWLKPSCNYGYRNLAGVWPAHVYAAAADRGLPASTVSIALTITRGDFGEQPLQGLNVEPLRW